MSVGRIILVVATSFLFTFCNNPAKTISPAGTAASDELSEKTGSTGKNTTANGLELGESYQNDQFYFSIRYPTAWQAQSHADPQGLGFVLNVIPSIPELTGRLPLRLHSDAAYSYVAVLPKGLGTEFPSGKMETFTQANPSLSLSFPVNREESRIFYLQNGEPWAYFIVPQTAPASWQRGFVFAQIGVENFQADCFDEKTGNKLDPARCDPLTGDKVVRRGKLKREDADAIKQILSSLQLDEKGASSALENAIRIYQPEQNSAVSSPLTVKGEARGPWFFEGSFSVVLYNSAGKRLATGIAKADGTWMTEEFVPFSATMKFPVPEDEKGRLVFQRANPSGLKRNADSLVVPVSFQRKNKN